MHDDTPIGAQGGSGAVAAEARVDERRPRRTRGAAGRPALVACTGALVLIGGVTATRVLLTGVAMPPWAEVALYTLTASVAVASMSIVARLEPSGVRGSPSIPDRAGAPTATDAALEPPATDAGTASGPPGSPGLERFQVDVRGGRRVVAAADVEWIEARGNYSGLHLPGESFLYRMPLSRLERELDARRFLRVHRSAIVNLDAIRSIEPLPSGDAELRLASSALVRMSRRYAKAFHERTGRGY